jgi:uncharacterized protein YndB with AHSA1/START domain
MPGNIHHELDISASPERVYNALLNSIQFAEATGAPATIEREVGDAFSCFNGMITGRHVELVPGQRIVQAWRVGTWEPGVYSIVRFELTPSGSGTRLIFDHTGFPPEHFEHLDSGWRKMYWDNLQNYLG